MAISPSLHAYTEDRSVRITLAACIYGGPHDPMTAVSASLFAACMHVWRTAWFRDHSVRITFAVRIYGGPHDPMTAGRS